MDVIYPSVAGLDIHKNFIVACVRVRRPDGSFDEKVRSFQSMTDHLLDMADWLSAFNVTHVAMEATGVLWKPVWNILEVYPFHLMLVNAHEVKQVPGRKSDVKDCQWIAHLVGCGLLKCSYVPSREQRELRDLTRHRAQLSSERTRCVNRIHKVLQDANIKLSSVATDIMGRTGRDILQALVNGTVDPEYLAEFARGRLRAKIPDLKRALQGHLQPHHQFMLEQLLDHLQHLESQLERFSARIQEALRPFVDEATFKRLDAIPGVNATTIENVVAEIGVDMSHFRTANHLASWAGVCPGVESSAGKPKRRRTTHGNVWLRRALGEAAWAAQATKGSYFRAQFRRLAARRGKKRALVAVGHSLLVVIYELLKHPHKNFCDLGDNYFDMRDPIRLQRHLVKRLEALGYDVTLTERDRAA